MAEQRNVNTIAIILNKYPLGENDFSVTLYSPELGKIQATAKGARKINGSLAGHIETFNLCKFQLYKSPVRYTIVQCQIQENFRTIRANLDLTMIAGIMVEIFHKSTISSEHSPELFDLLIESLHKLKETHQYFLTLESFKLQLLQHIGVLPDLESCAHCHSRLKNDQPIWLESNGHLQCDDCLNTQASSHANTIMRARERANRETDAFALDQEITTNAKPIEFNIIKLIHYLIQPISTQTKNITLNTNQKKQLEHITRFFLQHFLDREILGEKFLMQIIGESPKSE